MPNSVRLMKFVLPSKTLSILGCDSFCLSVLFHYLHDQPFDGIISIAKQKSRKCVGIIFHAKTAKVV